MLGLDEKSLRETERPTRRDLIYAMIGALFGIVLLSVQVARLYYAYVSGKLLISGDWYANMSGSPGGFAIMLIVHFAMTLFALVLVWYGAATLRHWLLDR